MNPQDSEVLKMVCFTIIARLDPVYKPILFIFFSKLYSRKLSSSRKLEYRKSKINLKMNTFKILFKPEGVLETFFGSTFIVNPKN